MEKTAKLEINFLQQDNDSPLKPSPITFDICLLKNGKYVLSKCEDHMNLQKALQNWQLAHNSIINLNEKYNDFLATNLEPLSVAKSSDQSIKSQKHENQVKNSDQTTKSQKNEN